jgi:hypothetical protein
MKNITTHNIFIEETIKQLILWLEKKNDTSEREREREREREQYRI